MSELAPSGPTILIVEDNELNLKLLNDILEYHGYSILAARVGEEAIQLARRYTPSLIILDMQLPDISGLEAARRRLEHGQQQGSGLRLRIQQWRLDTAGQAHSTHPGNRRLLRLVRRR
jgi:CheY-like chemotaxis protein